MQNNVTITLAGIREKRERKVTRIIVLFIRESRAGYQEFPRTFEKFAHTKSPAALSG